MTQLTQNIADEINEKHQALLGLAKRGLQDAIEIGLLLQQQKQSLPHGEWGRWISENLAFSRQQAQKYMQVAENRQLLLNDNRNCHLGIDAALKEIRALKAREKESDPMADLFELAETLGERDGFDTRQIPKAINQIKDLAGQHVTRIREWETTLRAAMKTWAEGKTLSDEDKIKVHRALNWHQEIGW